MKMATAKTINFAAGWPTSRDPRDNEHSKKKKSICKVRIWSENQFLAAPRQIEFHSYPHPAILVTAEKP